MNLEGPLHFHDLSGEFVILSPDKMTARRSIPDDEFTKATAFTHRLLKKEELFEITIDTFVECWSGSVQLGIQN